MACSSNCQSFRIIRRRCERGRWTALAVLEPSCACKPSQVPKALQSCQTSKVVLTPSIDAPNDGCKVRLACGESTLDVECDGENDGTGTSLCTCHRNGVEVRRIDSLWKGEGIQTCALAAERCLTVKD